MSPGQNFPLSQSVHVFELMYFPAAHDSENDDAQKLEE